MKKGKSDIAVHCSHSKMVPVADLKPHPRNPNRHPDTQVALLAKIIKAQGWRAPITVSKRSGFVVKGHARLAAALLIGVKTVPVDIQPYPDEAAELADMVADNRIAELAEMDMGALKDLLQELDTGAFDVDLTGYEQAALETLMNQYHPDIDNSQATGADFDAAGRRISSSTEAGSAKRAVVCPKCGEKFTIDAVTP